MFDYLPGGDRFWQTDMGQDIIAATGINSGAMPGTGGQSSRCHNCHAERYNVERFHSDMGAFSDVTNKTGVSITITSILVKTKNPYLTAAGVALGGTSLMSGYFSNTSKGLILADGIMFAFGFTGVGTVPSIGYGVIRSAPQTVKPNYSIRNEVRQRELKNRGY